MKTLIKKERATGGVEMNRRTFIKALGAGVIVAVNVPTWGQAEESGAAPRRGRGGGGGGPVNVGARIHIGKDGTITVMTGKVEGGQGSRAEITQAAAEELRVSPESVELIMGDTGLCPDDGGTFGSQTTPRSLPVVRQAAAGARAMLFGAAAAKWGVAVGELEAKEGKVLHAASGKAISYGELVGEDSVKVFAGVLPAGVTLTPVKEWKVMGTPVMRSNARDLVMGRHEYPTDVVRPGMMYGKALHAPSYGAVLKSVDMSAVQAIPGAVVVRDGDFVGVAAPSLFLARKAIDSVSKSAVWTEKPQVGSGELFGYLKEKARGIPAEGEMAGAKVLRAEYHVPYVQHAPMEPRAAVAEWVDGSLTVWTGTQNPFGVRTELMRAFGLGAEKVRVIVPDFGGGFGGKHTGEAAIEAARLAKGAGKPMWVRWTREEEFAWAYFRPAGVILAAAGLEADGSMASWYFVNINSGPSGLPTPYKTGAKREQVVQSDSPLKGGSYRGLAGTANHFARECFVDELAGAAGVDPLSYRLAHLNEERIAAVLKAAATKFGFADLWKQKRAGVGVGLACGMEKGSYVATCTEVAVDEKTGEVKVNKVCQAYECGKIVNPANLMSQVQGAVMMGIGPSLREEMKFEKGMVTNGTFTDYRVPRFADMPVMEIELLDRPDIASAGAGETPIMTIAPAIANAVFHATGERVRQMPVKVSGVKAVKAGI